jgi:hypothetical protein
MHLKPLLNVYNERPRIWYLVLSTLDIKFYLVPNDASKFSKGFLVQKSYLDS